MTKLVMNEPKFAYANCAVLAANFLGVSYFTAMHFTFKLRVHPSSFPSLPPKKPGALHRF